MTVHFKDQYKDPMWDNKRKKIYRRDKWHCLACNDTNVPLHCHHLYYDIGVKLWEYDDEALVTLCGQCHAKIHIDLKKISGLIAFKLLCNKVDIIDIDDRIDEILNYF